MIINSLIIILLNHTNHQLTILHKLNNTDKYKITRSETNNKSQEKNEIL